MMKYSFSLVSISRGLKVLARGANCYVTVNSCLTNIWNYTQNKGIALPKEQ